MEHPVRLKRVPVSNMQLYRKKYLEAMTQPEIIYAHETPVAVLMPYALYVEWREQVQKGQ